MSAQQVIEQLQEKFGQQVKPVESEVGDGWVEVGVDDLIAVCEYLRDDPKLRFDYLNCVSGVDYLESAARKLAKAKFESHVEAVYHLSSIELKHRITLKVMLPRWKDDKPGQLPEVPSLSGVWSTAEWHEREVFDLVGIRFVDHPDLRRILCPEDWQGHPLRKDYEMPTEYHGIRGG